MNSTLQEGCLYLKGAVTVQTLTASLYKQFMQQCAQPNVHSLDLSGVLRADSACISLLLSALRLRGKALQLNNLPASVTALAELYEIREWIQPWTPNIPEPLSFSHSV